MKLKSLLLLTAALAPLEANEAFAQAATSVSTYVIQSDSDKTGDNGLVLTHGGTNGTSQTTIATISSAGGSFSGDISLQGSLFDSTDNTVNVADGLAVSGATDLNNGLNVVGSTTLDNTAIVGVTSITGTTTINTTGAANSSIGTSGNTTSILSTTIAVGNATANSDVNIGTGTGANSVIMGNTNGASDITARAGNTTSMMANGTVVQGLNTGNIGTSLSAGTIIAENNFQRVVADENGKLEVVTSADTTSGTTAAMVVTNSEGNTHGLVVQEDKTVMSGGVSSTSLSLADNGATFSNSETGRPVQVHGVADGTADFDATNVRQLYSGLAAVLAATPELRLTPGKTGAGIGLGSYGGFHAVGFGLGHMYDNGAVLTVSAGKAAHSKVAYKAGLSWSW